MFFFASLKGKICGLQCVRIALKRTTSPSPEFGNAWHILILQKERVTRLLDEGHSVDLVYLDFAKAFDPVNHRFLLAKLKSSGIEGGYKPT